jgi:hypothetical protein
MWKRRGEEEELEKKRFSFFNFAERQDRKGKRKGNLPRAPNHVSKQWGGI